MFGIGFGFRYLHPFYDDDGSGGTGLPDVTEIPETPQTSDDDLDALAGDDDEDDEDEDEPDEDDEDEDDEDDVDEDEEKPAKKKKQDVVEEDDDEDEEKKPDVPSDKVPSIKALKTAYPDIFKKFPHVRTAIAEHQQFRSVFSSVDEARESAANADNFHQISEKLVDDGDFGFLFDEISKSDAAAATRMAKKILPAILERNRDLYMDITEAPITQFVHAAYRRAKADGNKNLENSALHVWKFLGKEGLPAPASAGPDPKDEEFQGRVREFESQKFRDASTSVTNSIVERLDGLIEAAIDPNDALKPTTKSALVKEIRRLVDADVAGDRNHMARVDRLWANARRSSYAQGHLSRITSAYLERAKQLLPKHARTVREENNISDGKAKRDEQGPRRRAQEPAPRPQSGGNPPRPRTIRDTNPRDIDWAKTSDEDVLSGKAVLRRR